MRTPYRESARKPDLPPRSAWDRFLTRARRRLAVAWAWRRRAERQVVRDLARHQRRWAAQGGWWFDAARARLRQSVVTLDDLKKAIASMQSMQRVDPLTGELYDSLGRSLGKIQNGGANSIVIERSSQRSHIVGGRSH